jgi:2-dehydropantoate 2-reductase
MPKRKIAIIGPGALGCLLAARFFEAGVDVTLVDYRPERVRLLKEQGLHLQDLDGSQKEVPVPIALPPEAGASELTIITVKSYQTGAAARALPLLMASGGLALTLQNGLGNLEELARVAGPQRLLAGVTFVGVTRRQDREIVYAGQGPTFIGPAPGARVTAAQIDGVVDLFRRAGLACQARQDIEVLLWEKLLVNVAINPLTALLRVPNGALPELPEAWELAVAAASEAAAVARAAGIALSADPEARLRQVCTDTAANRSSMLQDILAGRRTEIEALNAQVAKRGASLGVPTPTNDLLTRLLKSLEKSASQRLG